MIEKMTKVTSLNPSPIIMNENRMAFLKGSRLFTKKKKNWKGKKKPQPVESPQPAVVEHNEQQEYSNAIKQFFGTVRLKQTHLVKKPIWVDEEDCILDKAIKKNHGIFICNLCCKYYNDWNLHVCDFEEEEEKTKKNEQKRVKRQKRQCIELPQDSFQSFKCLCGRDLLNMYDTICQDYQVYFTWKKPKTKNIYKLFF